MLSTLFSIYRFFTLVTLLFVGLLSCSSDSSGPAEDNWATPQIRVQQNGNETKGLSQLKEPLATSSVLNFESEGDLLNLEFRVECDLEKDKRLGQSSAFLNRNQIRVEEILPRGLFLRPLPASNLCHFKIIAKNSKGTTVQYRGISLPVQVEEPVTKPEVDTFGSKVFLTSQLLELSRSNIPDNGFRNIICTSSEDSFDPGTLSKLQAGNSDNLQTCRIVEFGKSKVTEFSGTFRWSLSNPDLQVEVLPGVGDHLYLPVLVFRNKTPLPVVFSHNILSSGPLVRRQLSSVASQEQEIPVIQKLENLVPLGNRNEKEIFQIPAKSEGLIRLLPDGRPCKPEGQAYGYQFGIRMEGQFLLHLSSSPDSWSEPTSKELQELNGFRRTPTRYSSVIFWILNVTDPVRNIPWTTLPSTPVNCLTGS